MEIIESKLKKEKLLSMVTDEISRRNEAWESLCKHPDYPEYCELRAALKKTEEHINSIIPKLKEVEEEYNAMPDDEKEHGRLYLFAKMLKCQIKYKLHKNIKTLNAYNQAQTAFQNKRKKMKFYFNEYYSTKNMYEILLSTVKTIKENLTYKYFADKKASIKKGRTEDALHLDYFIYSDREFSPRDYSYETLITFKNYLTEKIAIDEKFLNL